MLQDQHQQQRVKAGASSRPGVLLTLSTQGLGVAILQKFDAS
jgi:hypothetical protein